MREHSGLFVIHSAVRKGKEVEEYSCLSIIQREILFNCDLEIGHEMGAP